MEIECPNCECQFTVDEDHDVICCPSCGTQLEVEDRLAA